MTALPQRIQEVLDQPRSRIRSWWGGARRAAYAGRFAANRGCTDRARGARRCRAEDVVQRVLVTAFHKLEQFRGRRRSRPG
jgi:hypothetical protein